MIDPNLRRALVDLHTKINAPIDLHKMWSQVGPQTQCPFEEISDGPWYEGLDRILGINFRTW